MDSFKAILLCRGERGAKIFTSEFSYHKDQLPLDGLKNLFLLSCALTCRRDFSHEEEETRRKGDYQLILKLIASPISIVKQWHNSDNLQDLYSSSGSSLRIKINTCPYNLKPNTSKRFFFFYEKRNFFHWNCILIITRSIISEKESKNIGKEGKGMKIFIYLLDSKRSLEQWIYFSKKCHLLIDGSITIFYGR